MVTSPDPTGLPPGLTAPTPPFFVALGTIEPRKDHLLLLDVWAGFSANLPAGATPRLVILGRVGWGADAIVARLRMATGAGQPILHLPDLPDAQVSALVAGASALLAPSRAEGFGLPATEAALLGTPVLATDLPATHEVLGDWPTYLPAGATADWSRAILAAARTRPAPRPRPGVPTWAEHFNRIFKIIG
jgi:glycosyltransferase involved in cell wall biosynthesis